MILWYYFMALNRESKVGAYYITILYFIAIVGNNNSEL